MRQVAFCGLLAFLIVTGCTHMDGVVKQVQFNKDGDLVITKCDEKLYWNFYFVAWGEVNCREEVKHRLSKSK
ncbi:MAG TPA: hypothetical protein VJL56_01850 [Candidatus Bathyarchaeia archaeon]|nr:hypothetical protein [Candidatus Bathyarchaeia archaeon]